jgi:uncharacterized membrane protein YccF (DUF307 family)
VALKSHDGGTGSKRQRLRDAARSGETWAGYAWFMSLGTILPLIVFIVGYAVNVTLVGAPLARQIYRFGIWLSTLGQEPPGKDKVEARKQAAEKKSSAPGKKSWIERVRRYSPPNIVERRGRPVTMPARIVWFVFVGWWLGAVWVIFSWSLFLLPYPMLDEVAALLAKLPSAMTLAWPKTAPPDGAPATASSARSISSGSGSTPPRRRRR